MQALWTFVALVFIIGFSMYCESRFHVAGRARNWYKGWRGKALVLVFLLLIAPGLAHAAVTDNPPTFEMDLPIENTDGTTYDDPGGVTAHCGTDGPGGGYWHVVDIPNTTLPPAHIVVPVVDVLGTSYGDWWCSFKAYDDAPLPNGPNRSPGFSNEVGFTYSAPVVDVVGPNDLTNLQ